jgi:hypothetical protein
MGKRDLGIAASGLVCGGLVMLAAMPAAADDKAEAHDGFFLRLAPGGGLLVANGANEPKATRQIGWAMGLHFEVGGCPIENLVVAGQFSFDMGFGTDAAYPMLMQGFVGLTVKWYFMPANVYLGGGLGVATGGALEFHLFGDDKGHDAIAGAGVGVQAQVGKEWWVSERWGVGLGLKATYGRIVRDRPGDLFGATLFLSASFN